MDYDFQDFHNIMMIFHSNNLLRKLSLIKKVSFKLLQVLKIFLLLQLFHFLMKFIILNFQSILSNVLRVIIIRYSLIQPKFYL